MAFFSFYGNLISESKEDTVMLSKAMFVLGLVAVVVGFILSDYVIVICGGLMITAVVLDLLIDRHNMKKQREFLNEIEEVIEAEANITDKKDPVQGTVEFKKTLH